MATSFNGIDKGSSREHDEAQRSALKIAEIFLIQISVVSRQKFLTF
jgi:hypothetical protein